MELLLFLTTNVDMNSDKLTVGILIFGDPTRGGTIASEVKFLASLKENNPDTEFVIITINPSVTKRVHKQKNTSYNFPHTVIPMFDESKFHLLESLDCLVTYPGHSNFFGGYLNDNVVKMYKIVSKCTNDLKIPVFIRINDSEIKVRDYRHMCVVRLKGKPESAFMKDPLNVKKAQDLVTWKEWDYKKVFWFANGSKEACDWVAETMYDREDEGMRMAPRQVFVDNTIYVSDDIFFLVRKNYERFSDYDLEIFKSKEQKMCYIGFFDTVNVMRAKALSTLFKENKMGVPLKIFGKGTEILTKLADKPNIEIEEGFIEGDSQEYFDFLNKHLGYIFIGKGHSESRYIGKTVYDAVVARTPIAVYRKCDTKQITFSNREYYFENETELAAIVEKLKDLEIRERWVADQHTEIMRKLPPSTFKFANFCERVPRKKLSESDIYTPPALPEKPVKITKVVKSVTEKPKTIALF
jgi:hypothetical protein